MSLKPLKNWRGVFFNTLLNVFWIFNFLNVITPATVVKVPIKSFQSLSLLAIWCELIQINSILVDFTARSDGISHIKVVAGVSEAHVEKMLKIVSSKLAWSESFHIVWQTIQICLLYVIPLSLFILLLRHVSSLPFTIVTWILRLMIIMNGVQQYRWPILAKDQWFFLLFLLLFLFNIYLLRLFLPLDFIFIDERLLLLLMIGIGTFTLVYFKQLNVPSNIFDFHEGQCFQVDLIFKKYLKILVLQPILY